MFRSLIKKKYFSYIKNNTKKMDMKIIVIVVLAILLTLGGWYIANDKYQEFKEEMAVNLYNAWYQKWILDIIEISEKKVDAECEEPVIPLFSGDNTINLVDTRCLGVIFQEIKKQQDQQLPENSQQDIQDELEEINK